MKFQCDSCRTNYSIADERVHGRVLKIRCKSCSNVITLRGEHGVAASHSSPEVAVGHRASNVAAEFKDERTMASEAPPLPTTTDDWFVSFDGSQEGPLRLVDAVERVRVEQASGKESYAWRAGFAAWLPVESVPELARALKRRAPPPTPAAPSATPELAAAPKATPKATPKAAKSAPASVSLFAAKSEPATKGVEAKPVVASEPTPPLKSEPASQRPSFKNESASQAAASFKSEKKSDAASPKSEKKSDAASPKSAPAEAAKGEPAADQPADPRVKLPWGLPPRDKDAASPAKLDRDPGVQKALWGAAKLESPPEAAPAPSGRSTLPAKRTVRSLFGPDGPESTGDAQPAAAKTPSAGLFARAPLAPATDASAPPATGTELSHELVIGEASGMFNLSHIMGASAMQRPASSTVEAPSGPAITTPNGSPSSTAPVVVVTGPAAGSASWHKWAAVAGWIAAVSAVGVGVFLHMRSSTKTDAAQNGSSAGRMVEDKPIAISEPPRVGLPSPEHDVKRAVAPTRRAVAPRPQAGGKGGSLSGSQQALANLYGEGTDHTAIHGAPTLNSPARAQAQVSDSALRNVVTQNQRSLNLCYDRVLKHDPSLKRARIVVQVKIGISGSVTGVSVPGEFAKAEIGTCLVQTVRRWHFPAAEAEYQTEFPLLLQAAD